MALNSSTIFKVSPAYKHRMLSNGYGKHVASKSTRCSLIPNRLNTKELLQRKCFFMPTKRCKLCETTGLETRTRLFFECSFAVMCWKYLCPEPQIGLSQIQVQDIIASLQAAISKPFPMDIIILVCWDLWTTRNDLIFKHIQLTFYRCRKKNQK
jgi:hypothetical protein